MCVRVGTDGEKRHHADTRRGSARKRSSVRARRCACRSAGGGAALGSGSDKVQHILVKKKFLRGVDEGNRKGYKQKAHRI